MLAREQPQGRTQVAFVVPADGPDGSVGAVGGFHHRHPAVYPPQARSDGSRAAAVVLPAHTGGPVRCLAAGDYWFDDDHADGHDGADDRVRI